MIPDPEYVTTCSRCGFPSDADPCEACQAPDLMDVLDPGAPDPDLRRDIVTLGFVHDVKITEGSVAFRVELTTPACPVKDLLQQQAHDASRGLRPALEWDAPWPEKVLARPRSAQRERSRPRSARHRRALPSAE